MQIPKTAQITDSFKCSVYHFSNAIIPYKVCINRQNSRLASGVPMYPECEKCQDGKAIAIFFKGYKREIKKHGKQSNFATSVETKIASILRERLKKDLRGGKDEN